MSSLFDAIERIRRLPEPIRRQVLWAIVGCFVVVFGIVWLFTLSWQFEGERLRHEEASEQTTEVALPSPSESLKEGIGQIGSSVRDMLRLFILEEKKPQPSIAPVPEVPGAQEEPIKLPGQ